MSNKSSKQKWVNTLQFFAGYLVAAWTFLQFIDWILNRYDLSPNWVDFLLWTFIGIIPSLLIYLYHRDRINRGIIKLKEKILIPINILLLAGVLFIAFGNTDMGATTKRISFENSTGNLETKTFTKEEFRAGIPIYHFSQQQEKDSAYSWLEYGIGKILVEDLLQNKNLSPEYKHRTTTTQKIRDASLFHDKYVDGEFKIDENNFIIKASIRKATNAKVLVEQIFKGDNLFKLLDDVSVFIASGIDKKGSLTYVDLPIDEHITNSEEALKAFVQNDYDKAYSIDDRFSLAYLEDVKIIMSQNRGNLEAKDIIDKAYATKSKLPLQKQLEVSTQKNLVYGNFDDAEKQVKLQLEVDPNNKFYNSVLFSIYGETKNTEAFFRHAENLFETNKSSYNGNILAVSAMVVGYEDKLLDALNALSFVNPSVKYLKIEPLIFNKEFTKAKDIFDDYKASYSGNKNRLKIYDSIFSFLEKNSIDKAELKNFEGSYRSNLNEQQLEFWLENGRLIEHVKNQSMKPYIPAGKDAVGGGFIEDYTYYARLLRDSNQESYAIQKSFYYWNGTSTILYWKINDNIESAFKAFKDNDLEKAKTLFANAKQDNPKHLFIDNILEHINFKKQTDSTQIIAQFKMHEGNYGPRNFWIENGKFYYKRINKETNLPKVELLPLNDTLYMDMTRLGTLMSFTAKGDQLISKSYSLDTKSFEWVLFGEEQNIFPKD